jgi:hypothetical protein
MRRQWSCPDVAEERDEGTFLLIESTDHEFPECPAAYLRTPGDLVFLADRFGKPAFAPHLDGGQHPAQLISMYASEIELGARPASSLPPLVIDLVHLWMNERQKFTNRENELRRAAR